MDIIILAGGKGSRMEDALPKPLVIVRGKPIIEHQIDYIAAQQGVERIIISLGVRADEVREHLLKRYPTLPIFFAIEEKLLGTAGGVKNAMKSAVSDRVIVLNCDDITNIDLNDFAKQREHCVAVAHPRLPFGLVNEKDGYAVFEEKPILPQWVSAGWYSFGREDILSKLPDEGSLEYDVFPKIKLKVYYHEGTWYTLNSKKDISIFEEANNT